MGDFLSICAGAVKQHVIVLWEFAIGLLDGKSSHFYLSFFFDFYFFFW